MIDLGLVPVVRLGWRELMGDDDDASVPAPSATASVLPVATKAKPDPMSLERFKQMPDVGRSDER